MALFKMLEFDAMIIDPVVCLDGAGSHYSSSNQSTTNRSAIKTLLHLPFAFQNAQLFGET